MNRLVGLCVWMVVISLGLTACSAQAVPTPMATVTLPSAIVAMTSTMAAPPPDTSTVTLSNTWTATATATPTPSFTPTDTAMPSPTPTNTAVIYLVQPADSLFLIAAQFHVDIGALTAVNQLTTTVLAVGQTLIIPGADFATPTPSPIPAGLPAGTKIEYKVRLGDTLASIAAQFNSTADAISQANPDPAAPNNAFRRLTDQNLQAELVIVVPVNVATPAPTATVSGG